MYSQSCRNYFLEVMVFTKTGIKIKIFSQPPVHNSDTEFNLNPLRGFEDETRG
jgi:hypothetical protein